MYCILCAQIIYLLMQIKEKKIRKDNIFKLRMNDSDLKNLNKISKILKITNSETIRLLIESKIKELNKQKNIFE